MKTQTPFQQDDFNILLITIYCFVDDFQSHLLTTLLPALKRPDRHHPPRRKRKLSTAEIVTLAIFFHFTGHKDWRHFYIYIKTYHHQDFPNLPSYQKFVSAVNDLAPYALIMTMTLCRLFRDATPVSSPKFTDSTKLAVCHIKREFSHKVMKNLASKSKSTMGWFYGFKLHLICNELMEILDCRILTAAVDDRAGLEKMWAHVFGLIVADAGYLGADFAVKARSQGKILLTGVKKNMKKLLTQAQHQLLKMRQVVETTFSVLKFRMNMETTLPRSPLGYFARYVWCLAAYQLKKYFDRLARQNQLETYLLA